MRDTQFRAEFDEAWDLSGPLDSSLCGQGTSGTTQGHSSTSGLRHC